MDEVEALRAERQVIEMELKNTDTDGTRTRLLAAFQTGSYNDENSVVVNEIDAIYQPLRQQVNQSVSKQEQLVEHIRRAHQQFLDETKGNRSSAMRDEMLRNLASAYDTYQELSSNLREGSKVSYRFTFTAHRFKLFDLFIVLYGFNADFNEIPEQSVRFCFRKKNRKRRSDERHSKQYSRFFINTSRLQCFFIIE